MTTHQITAHEVKTARATSRPADLAGNPVIRPVPAAQAARPVPALTMGWRRAFVLTLNGVSLALLAWAAWMALASGGWSVTDMVLFVAIMMGAPWVIMGMWNAVLGLWLLHFHRNGLQAAAPHLAAGQATGPLTTRTALAMTIRNEPPEESFRVLAAMRRDLDQSGYGHHFDIHILSDTSDPVIARAEEQLFKAMRAELGGPWAHYRRREKNTAWKAGNLREFMIRRGRDYAFCMPLDSDSQMSADGIIRMVRIMEAHPRIGILQSLTMGLPSASLFTRAVSFGARIANPAYLTGSIWWHGDTSLYWGHNALLRISPFLRYCRLPVLRGRPPLGGHILSHDLPEAALMRRAGLECRVIPIETGSKEGNPPALTDFIRRDLRWCNGNMQVTRLQTMRRMTPLSRFHLFTAAVMYLAAPAWMVMILALAGKLMLGVGGIDPTLGMIVFFGMLTATMMPKVAGIIDSALTPGRVASFGGKLRLAFSAVTEFLISVLMAPALAVAETIFLIGLAFGRRMDWGGQNRDANGLGWAEASRALWPQTLFGFALMAIAATFGGLMALAWASPILASLCLAIPFAVITAHPVVGNWAERIGLCALPEETATPQMAGPESSETPRRAA